MVRECLVTMSPVEVLKDAEGHSRRGCVLVNYLTKGEDVLFSIQHEDRWESCQLCSQTRTSVGPIRRCHLKGLFGVNRGGVGKADSRLVPGARVQLSIMGRRRPGREGGEGIEGIRSCNCHMAMQIHAAILARSLASLITCTPSGDPSMESWVWLSQVLEGSEDSVTIGGVAGRVRYRYV